MLIEISDKDFQQEVLDSKKLVLIDFWAPWCGPCKMLGPILEDLANEMQNVKIVKINIDENLEVPSQLGIRSIPTLMLYKAGQNISTKVGVLPKNSLKEWIESNL
ncbi:MAG: thioredoxin [Rickettsiaceae bacterium]|nr:thioredoxin [Rickettsiaceae bacterium]